MSVHLFQGCYFSLQTPIKLYNTYYYTELLIKSNESIVILVFIRTDCEDKES